MPEIDKVDKEILNEIQSNFPVTSKPYMDVARKFNLSEDDVIHRLKKLKEDGIIRRIGGNFSPEKLDFVSTLCAAKVPVDQIASFADVVNAYEGVTHNYQRENEYNIWFTFIAPSRKIIEKNLKEIQMKTGISNIMNLPATHVFKIRAEFNL